MSFRPAKQLGGALAGLALCVSSTAAGATSTISPMVALSAFGTAQSSGAVLPVVDQPAPAAEPAYVPPPAEGGPSLLVLLGGLALVVGLAALVFSGDSDGDIDLPPFSPD